MLLAADVGNTNIKLGLFSGSKLAHTWRLASDLRRTADEYGLLIAQLVGRPGARSSRFGAIRTFAVASVVPALSVALATAGQRLFRRPVLMIDHGAPFGFHNGYQPPQDVGVDRLVDAAAALAGRKPPLIIVDFGTAVTVNVVSRQGVYLGGAIAPGLELAADALFRRTTKLPPIALAAPRSAIGRGTLEAMRSGVVLGAAAAVDGLLERIFRELGERPSVVATGGTAALVVPLCRHVKTIEPDLTLHGIRLLSDRMTKGARA